MENQNKVQSYQELVVWQKAKDFTVNLYRDTEQFPKNELYGLTSQLRRAAVSVPSNIAEGYRRKGLKEREQFFRIAFGSAAEVETQLIIAKELGYISDDKYENLNSNLEEVLKMPNKILQRKQEL